MKYDAVYYWKGDRTKGEWCFSAPTSEIKECIKNLNEAGYVCHRGVRNIGAPEGPPDESEFKALDL